MASAVKVSIIGAGSGEFSLGIVRDLCLIPDLRGSLVSFMDINQGRLDAVTDVATRFAREVGADVKFEKTLDRRHSLRDADFVINSAMVVPWDKRTVTQEIGRKWGYPRAPLHLGLFHQLDLFMGVVRDMEDICPDAWYIQSANPVFDGCTLVTRKSSIKTVGLCHGINAVKTIARHIGLDPAKVDAQAWGINHFIWMTKFTHEGKDAYPILDRWIEEKAEAYWNSPEFGYSEDLGPKAIDVYRRLGLFPIGDTVTPGGGSNMRWYHADKETELRWKEDPTAWFDRHVNRVGTKVTSILDLAKDPARRVTDVIPTERTKETNVSIIDAIANDKPQMFQVNIPNRGSIDSVADDVVVEVPGLVSAAGIQGLHMGDLPKPITCQMLEKILQMERILHAWETGDKRALVEVVLANAWTKTIEQAHGVLDEMLAQDFNRPVAEHFSGQGVLAEVR